MSQKTRAVKDSKKSVENSGRFKKGNEIGKETRLKPGHTLSKKYTEDYAFDLLTYFEEAEDLVFVEDWAVSRKISIRAINDWLNDEEKYPLFATHYKQAMAIQLLKLSKGGLKGDYNARLVEFLLKNNHGMRDKVEQKLEGGTNDTLTVEIREVN